MSLSLFHLFFGSCKPFNPIHLSRVSFLLATINLSPAHLQNYSVPLPSPLLLHFSTGFYICSIQVSSTSDNRTDADVARLAVHTATRQPILCICSHRAHGNRSSVMWVGLRLAVLCRVSRINEICQYDDPSLMTNRMTSHKHDCVKPAMQCLLSKS